MDAGKAIIDSIFASNRLLEIPFYQRSYVWKEEQWERFKADMEYVTEVNKPYFLGSVILKELPTPSSSESRITDRRVVIDGQQRLTTIMLFFKALYLLNDSNDDFKSDFCLKGGMPKLEHGKADSKAFSYIMAIGNLDDARNIQWDDGKSNIVEAFKYFLNNIETGKLEDIVILKNVCLIAIDIQQDEDEQQIFDTINSLGVTLTTAELLKNYLFNRDNVSEYEKYWESIFEPVDDADTREWWNQEIVTGRVKRTVIDLFFDSLLQILVQDPVYGVSSEDKIAYARVDQLFHSYQDFMAKYYNKMHGGENGNIDFLEEMSVYAKIFKSVFEPNVTSQSVTADDYLKRINIVIFGLKNSTLIPYILYLEKNVSDEQHLTEMLKILESFIMRRIATRDTTKNYNRLFTSLILKQANTSEKLVKELKSNEDTTTRFPSDADLIKAFESESKLTNLQTKGLLYLIEASIRPKNSGTNILTFDSYSLEHLMPKKWRNNWKHPETQEEAAARDKALLTLGNLAIITQSLNASIRDANWDKKRKGNGDKNPGLEKCSGGLTTFEGVLEIDAWDEDAIRARGDLLGEKAVSVWPYPDGGQA